MVAGADDRLFHPPVQGGHHATGPHEQAHRETDRQTDRDILEPSFGGGQSRGEQQREHDDDRDAEACLPHGQREGPRRVGRDHGTIGSSTHHTAVLAPTSSISPARSGRRRRFHQRLDRRAAVPSASNRNAVNVPNTIQKPWDNSSVLAGATLRAKATAVRRALRNQGESQARVPLDPIPDSLRCRLSS